MNKSRWQWIIACVVVLLGLMRPIQTTFAVACSFPISPAGGTYALDQSCSVTADTLEGLDYANNIETATANAATIAVPTGVTLTVPSGIAGSTTLTTGTLSLTGGAIVMGSSNAQIKLNTALYVADADADGWASNTTYYTATASGKRRLGLMRSFSTLDCNDAAYSVANSCASRRNIALTYSGTTLTNYDIVFSVDTATSIANTKMTADCGDIRMKDSDGTTALPYWIEGGCNTATTQIWTRVPSIPDGGKTIYMDYDGTTTTDGFEAWAGSFTLMNTAACPAGWTRNADLDGRFPYGAVTYGTTGGVSSHTHGTLSCNGSSSPNQGCAWATETSIAASLPSPHGYAIQNPVNSTSVLPPYLDMVFCESSDLTIPSGMISSFSSSAPVGWTRYASLDTKFPRGAVTAGGTGGVSTHTHTTNAVTGALTSTSDFRNGTTAVRRQHSHASVAGVTDAENNTPPYVNMVYASADAQTKAVSDIESIVNLLPPLGWNTFSTLSSKFPRGESTYGATGGSATHTHTDTLVTGQPISGASTCLASGTAGTSAAGSHTHSCTTTSDAQSNLPPYLTVIFAQRNTPLPTVSVGPEQ